MQAPREAPYRFPNPDEWGELCATLKLDARQSQWLRTSVAQIVDDIGRHHAAQELLKSQGSRREALAELRRLSKRLENIEGILEGFKGQTERLLRRAYGDTLGRLMSNAAVTSALNKRFHHGLGMRDMDRFEGSDASDDPDPPMMAWSPSPPGFHDMESYAAQAYDGPWRFFEEHCEQQRRHVARQKGSQMLSGLIRELDRPVRVLLDLERQNRGGSPGKLHRKHVVQKLAQLYVRMFDETPTSTPGGRFVLLCELVLTAIGLDTEGLDQAVARALRRMKAA